MVSTAQAEKSRPMNKEMVCGFIGMEAIVDYVRAVLGEIEVRSKLRLISR